MNFWDSLRFPLVFLTTKACKAPINGTHISKGHLLKISLNHTLDSALLVEGFAKIVSVFNVPGPLDKTIECIFANQPPQSGPGPKIQKIHKIPRVRYSKNKCD